MRCALLLVAVFAGSASADTVKPVKPAEPVSPVTPTKTVITDTRCATPPIVKASGFRHKRSKLIAKVGSPNHRGIDLIATVDDAQQHIAGKLAHGKFDKDIEDEDAEVFACLAGRWKSLGVRRTNGDGRFSITLAGAARLPVGMRDMYVVSRGDATGAYFVAYVAPRGVPLVVTDVDGTISWSENAIIKTVIDRDHDIRPRPHAPQAFSQLPYPILYTTARGDVLLPITRRWLERHGFPRGLVRVANGLFAKPGSSAIKYKSNTLSAITVPIIAGIGNRKSDITAYSSIGLTGKQILIHLPEYEDEVKQDIAAGKATGFADYRQLPRLVP